MAANIHIYIQDAYQESRNLRSMADEVESSSKEIDTQIEELMSVWRGASARRVQMALTDRSADASKISNNLNIIADALQRTAKVYEDAQVLRA